MNKMKPRCLKCGDEYALKRLNAGYRTCLWCGEEEARSYKHTIVPMPKSNYIVVSDLSLLVGLNSSHKGGSK
jgi:ribosomal protein L37AE/L43A